MFSRVAGKNLGSTVSQPWKTTRLMNNTSSKTRLMDNTSSTNSISFIFFHLSGINTLITFAQRNQLLRLNITKELLIWFCMLSCYDVMIMRVITNAII